MTTTNLTTTIDRLGVILAQKAELIAEEKLLKGVLVDNGAGAYEGDFYRATVSIAERGTLDMKAVREKLTAQFIRAHTNVTEVTTVKVVARNGK
jgi:hypothetical protein